jgi:hypothetical protein
MVDGYNMDTIGDSLVVRKGPFNNIVGFSNWNVLGGITIPNETVGTVSVDSDDNTVSGTGTHFTRKFDTGSSIIINNKVFTVLSVDSDTHITISTSFTFSVSNVQFYAITDLLNNFSYEFRWSNDGVNFSEYGELNDLNEPGSLTYIITNSSDDNYVDFKITVNNLEQGNSLTVLDSSIFRIMGTTVSPELCHVACDDTFSTDGGAVIEVICNTNTFNPYAQNKSINLYKQLNNIVSDMFGHDVSYFRTEPDTRTKDVSLMEYSLHNVVANENIKILVPDNEFPEEANTFDIFGMEFAEFEVHIVHDKFKKVFGDNLRPRSKDYMFIPIINKMYEISSVSIADEFNAARSYWRIKLVKYQDRSSVIKGDFTEDITLGIEDVFGEEIKDEQESTIKPEQYQTVSHVVEDGVRTYINNSLKIIDNSLTNNYATISKNYYDLSDIQYNQQALEYGSNSEIKSGESLSATMWFKPKFKVSDTTTYTLLGDSNVNGFRLKINTTDIISNTGGVSKTFNHNIIFDENSWYSIILNINNTYKQISITIFKLTEGQYGVNTISNVYSGSEPTQSAIEWSYGDKFNLVGGKLNITNVRVFNKPMDSTEYLNIINQYVVKDNQHALVIDNAVPSLGYQRFKNAR